MTYLYYAIMIVGMLMAITGSGLFFESRSDNRHNVASEINYKTSLPFTNGYGSKKTAYLQMPDGKYLKFFTEGVSIEKGMVKVKQNVSIVNEINE